MGAELAVRDPLQRAESVAQVRDIAARTGQRGRGERLAADIERAATADPGPRVTALIWQGGGMVPGSGTLADDLLRRTGFANYSAALGLAQWDVLGLEYLVARPPRVLFTAPGATDRALAHPVLRTLRGRTTIRAFPSRLLWCGGPAIPEALRTLRAARAAL